MYTENFLKLFTQAITGNTSNVTVKSLDGTDANGKGFDGSNSIYGYMPGYFGTAAFVKYDGCMYHLTDLTAGKIYYGNNWSAAAPFHGVILGDGDATPTPSDYNLSGNYITGFTASTAGTCVRSDNIIICTGTYTISNNSGSDYNIKEFGLFRPIIKDSAVYTLLYRDLLVNPVIIENGQTGIVTIQIKITL